MKNKLFKTCLTGLALSVAGIAGADQSVNLADYSAVSGAVMNIASGSTVVGKLAASAALTFGTNAKMGIPNSAARPGIYAGAAVTIGDGAIIGDVIAGAAVGIGAGANASNVTAGAAVTLGANAQVGVIRAGGAITMGAGSYASGSVSMQDAVYLDLGSVTTGSNHMTSLKSAVDDVVANAMVARDNCIKIDNTKYDGTGSACATIGTNITGETYGPGTYYGSASGTAANGVVTLDGDANAQFNFILSGALTFGANSKVKLEGGAVAENVTWTTGSSINIGANTEFRGMAYSGGSINASTSEVHCGALYAAGAVSVKSIGLEDC